MGLFDDIKQLARNKMERIGSDINERERSKEAARKAYIEERARQDIRVAQERARIEANRKISSMRKVRSSGSGFLPAAFLNQTYGPGGVFGPPRAAATHKGKHRKHQKALPPSFGYY